MGESNSPSLVATTGRVVSTGRRRLCPVRLSSLWCRGSPFAEGLQWGWWRRSARQGKFSHFPFVVSDAGAAGNGPRTHLPSAGLAGAVESAQGRVLDGGFVVVGKGQLNEAVKVLEHFGVTLDRRLPVFIDAALELGLGSGNLVGVGWCVVVVVGVSGDAVEVRRMSGLAALSKQPKVLEDVVLSVSPHP